MNLKLPAVLGLSLAVVMTLACPLKAAETVQIPPDLKVGEIILTVDPGLNSDGEYTGPELQGTRGTFEVLDGRLHVSSEETNPLLETQEISEFASDLVIALKVSNIPESDNLQINLPNGAGINFSRRTGALQIVGIAEPDRGVKDELKNVNSSLSGKRDEIVILTTPTTIKIWLNGDEMMQTNDLELQPFGKFGISSGWASDWYLDLLTIYRAAK
jgi:hypothetical protein